jgi:hypothetical protein
MSEKIQQPNPTIIEDQEENPTPLEEYIARHGSRVVMYEKDGKVRVIKTIQGIKVESLFDPETG